MAKTDFLTADMTRRHESRAEPCRTHPFRIYAVPLRLLSGWMPVLATWALPRGLLVVNADLCTGCQRCGINCT